MSIKNAKLVYDEQYFDASARIWLCEDGTHLFECLRSSGKDLSVKCPTIDSALTLWENTKTRLNKVSDKENLEL